MGLVLCLLGGEADGELLFWWPDGVAAVAMAAVFVVVTSWALGRVACVDAVVRAVAWGLRLPVELVVDWLAARRFVVAAVGGSSQIAFVVVGLCVPAPGAV